MNLKNPNLILFASVFVALSLVLACSDDDDKPNNPDLSDTVDATDQIDPDQIDPDQIDPDQIDPDVQPDEIEPDTASLRVLHLSADAPAVDVFVNGGADPAIEALAFGASTPPISLPVGSYDFDIAAAGTTEPVLTISDAMLEADMAYSALAFNRLANLEALIIVDELDGIPSSSIRVRAVHVAPDVGQVDIWALGETPTPLFVNLDFGAASDTADLPATAHAVGIDVDADAVPDLSFSIPELPAGTYANLFAVQDEEDAVILLAQLPDGTTVRIPADLPAPEQTMLRVLHLSPDAPAVDIFVNGSSPAAITELAFGVATPYVSLDAGIYDFDVAATGAAIETAVLSIEELELMADKKYTAVALGKLASISALALEDAAVSEPGQIKVRAIHAADGVGAVDIWNLPLIGEPGILYENVPFGAAGGYLDLPPGAYTLGIDANDDANPDFVFELPALEAGTVASVFAVLDDQGVLTLRALLENSDVAVIDVAAAKISVIHLSPDAPDVDIFVNDGATAAVTALAFPESTGYIDLPVGVYQFDVAPTGAGIGSAVISLDDAELRSGTRATAIAFDFVAELKSAVMLTSTWGLDDGAIRVRAIHAAAGVGEVDIWNVSDAGNPAPLFVDFGFGELSEQVDIPAGAYSLGFDVDNDANPDLVFSLPALDAGTVADIFAVNGDGSVFLLVQFADGSTARIDAM
ncbi:MAG: DUF4397 domain-containing protein [Myxococcota bacterium]|jgi:hypothetical protein|nr:DUF4397 domain-containing protein [Myxococcota bacterium]